MVIAFNCLDADLTNAAYPLFVVVSILSRHGSFGWIVIRGGVNPTQMVQNVDKISQCL